MLDRNCIEMKLSYDEQYLILKHEKTIILIDVNTLETKEYEIEVPYDSQHDFDYYSKLKKLIITNRDVQIITLEPTPVYCKVLNPHKRNDYSNNYMLRIGSDKPLFLTCFQKVIKIWSLSNNKNIGQVICNHTINSANFVRNRNRLVASEYRSIHVYCLRTYRKIMSYYLNTGSGIAYMT